LLTDQHRQSGKDIVMIGMRAGHGQRDGLTNPYIDASQAAVRSVGVLARTASNHPEGR
jgi:hypothetical protein